jgi:aminopeptidase N
MKIHAIKPHSLLLSVLVSHILLSQSENDSKKHIYSYNPEYRATNTLITDILHTTLYVKPIWDSSILIGKAEITLKPYFYSTDKIFLNARGMRIHSIKINDLKNKTSIPFSYKYENDSIKIQMKTSIPSTQTLVVSIDYVAQPEKIKAGGSNAIQSDKGLFFVNPQNRIPGKIPQIWTQGETQSNSVWFPTVDSPNEKMTHDIYITVDKKYTTLSNGLLVETKQNSDGTKTDHWKMSLPHAPYLVMMAIGEFKKVTDKPWKNKEISYYVEPAYEPYAKAIFHNTYKMIDFFSSKLGVDFAWPKYAQIIVRDYVSGAMENTSATLHGEFLYQTDRDTVDGINAEDVISHELFHQWFGDLVTCESWSNLPLNESFATYGEYLWQEYAYGRDAADEHHYFSARGYFARHSSPSSSPPLIRFFYDNREDMFDGISYNKGGQVLHMLRKLVGDDAFFQSLQLYLTKNMFKPVEIHHLRLAFEEVTGQDLNWFFNQWFMYGGHPQLTVQKNYDSKNKLLTIIIEQKQPAEFPLYRLPLYIDIYTTKSIDRKHITIQNAKQTFTFSIDEQPLLVNFDAERQLLAEINYPKSDDEYLYQLQHAPLWQDRFEAIQNLKKKISDKKVIETLINYGLKDKYKGIRSEVINILKDEISTNNSLKNKIISMAQTDPSAKVRSAALSALSSLPDSETMTLYLNALRKEFSSDIISTALNALNNTDKKIAQEQAQKFENDKSKSIIMSILNIYADSGNEKYWPYFNQHISTFTGFEVFGYATALSKYIKNLNHSATALAIAKTLYPIYQSSSGMTAFALKKILKELDKNWTDKEKNLMNAIQQSKQNNEPTKNLEDQLRTVSETLKEIQNITSKL